MASEPAWLVGQRAASAVRFELELGHHPVDAFDVLRRRGVMLAIRDLGEDDGRYLFHAGRALAIVSSKGPAARQRFTAAHELGHHELHRFVDEGEQVAFVDGDVLRPGDDPREVAANSFAACLLLPERAILEAVAEAEVTVELVGGLVDRFGLSWQATIFRLHNVRAMSAAQRDVLLESARPSPARRADKQEPLPAQLPHEHEAAVTKLLRAGVIDAERAADLLETTREEAMA